MSGIRRTLTCGLAAFLFIAGCVTPRSASDIGNGGDPIRVLLIGWDGAGCERVRECLGRGELPALQSVLDAGMFADIVATGTTDTKAGWAEILTGYGPEITGVHSNVRFNAIPEGTTIFERLEESLGKNEIFTAAVIANDHHAGGDAGAISRALTRREANVVTARNRIAAARRRGKKTGRLPALPASLLGGEVRWRGGRLFLTSPAEPYYFTSRRVDVWRKGVGSNRAVGEAAIALLERIREKPFFIFIHFIDLDRAGHASGEHSRAYRDALVSCDEWTGKILNRLEDFGLLDNTLVYITADHGFDEGKKTHARAPHVFLATNDRTVRYGGTRLDIAPTIYRRLGMDPGLMRPELAGRPLPEPRTILTDSRQP